MLKNWLHCGALVLMVGGCGKPGAEHSGVATLEELNRAWSVMSMAGARAPTNVTELTNFPSLRGKILPVPPAGKKLVIDRSQNQVVLVAE